MAKRTVNGLTRIAPDTPEFMDCDYCGQPMDWNTYAIHACDGLKGLNPLAEKLKNANWKQPGINGTVSARGSIVDPREAVLKKAIRGWSLAVFIAVAGFALMVVLNGD